MTSMLSPDQQSTHSDKELRRIQHVERVEFTKPVRQICRLDTSSPKIGRQVLQDLYDSLPRFGPFYIADDESLASSLKEASWQHVLRRSSLSSQSETITTYFTTLKEIEAQARNAYVDDAVDNITRSRFIWMMIKDGCFILQLALFALGGSEQLAHPPDDPVFGNKRNSEQIRRWTKSLFFVGNQIPLVVLIKLMNQSFFQQVVLTGKWEQPTDLFSRVLYDLLVLPVLESSQYQKPTTLRLALYEKLGLQTKANYLLQQDPTDLLHGLHMLVIGPGGGSTDEHKNEVRVGAVDIESSALSYTIPSATELRQSGIHFKHIKGMGSEGINFQTNMFRAVLSLPTFLVDDGTEVLFQYLKNYEISQPLGSNKHEVCSYLQFLSELIRTPEDAKLLARSGIIRATPEQRERLPGIVNRLASGDTNQNLRLVRLQIDGYSRPPWKKIRNFLSLVLLLTVVQTVYTVLGYYKKP